MGLLKAIIARVGLDGSDFERGAIKVENSATRMGKNVLHELKGIAAGAAAAFTAEAILHSIEEVTSRIHQLSKEYRISTDTAQKWEVAGKRIGESADLFGAAFAKAKKAREAAVGGDKGAVEAFGKLGVSMDDLRDASKSTESILEDMARVFEGRSILDDEDVAGMEIFGKSGAKVLSAMIELKNLGPISTISKEDIEAWHQIEKSFAALKREATVKAAPFLSNFMGGLSTAIKEIGLEVDIIRGKKTRAQANAELEEHAKALIPGGAEAEKDDGDRHYTASKLVDLNKDAKEIESEREALARKIFENQVAAMNTEQKRVALKEKIAKLEDKATRALYEGNDAEALKLAKEAEEMRGQLIADERKKSKDLQTDSLNKIGGYVGGAEQTVALVEREQLAVMTKHLTVSQKILEEIRRSTPGAILD